MNKNRLVIGTLLTLSAASYHWIIKETTPAHIIEPPIVPLVQDKIAPIGVDPVLSSTVSIKKKTQQDKDTQQEIPQAMAKQFSILSKAYAEEMSYPSYSVPLNSTNTHYLEPNHFSVIDVPVLDGTHSAALSFNKYRFDFPEPIIATLRTDLPVQYITYQLIDPKTRHTLDTKQSDSTTVSFTTEKSWPQEIRIIAKVAFNEGVETLVADVRFSNPVALVESVSAPYSSGSDMIIPLNVEIKESGTYRIRANLYQHSGQPIASLNNKIRLSEGETQFNLKAHKSVLINRGDDFELRNITVEKMSDFPGEATYYGATLNESYSIDSFSVSELSDEPYHMSEEEKKRLKFLEDIAQQ